MLKRCTHWIGATGLAVLVGFSAPGLAFDHEYSQDPSPGRMLAYLADELDLTQAQEDEIRALYRQMRTEGEADRERLVELHELLQAQVVDFDAGTAQRYADEIGEITTRLAYAGVRTRVAVREVLNDEQRIEMEAIMQGHRERRERWHRNPPGGKYGRPGPGATD